MKVFVSTGNRYRALTIDSGKKTADLAYAVVKAGFQKGIYAFSLYFKSFPLKEGTLSGEGLTENCLVVARPTLSSSIDLQIRTPDKNVYVTEAFPDEKISDIKERFIKQSGLKPESNFFVMNSTLLNDPTDILKDHLLRESDVIYVVPSPENLPSGHTFIYCSLGNDLLMQLIIKDSDDVLALKKAIARDYKIPVENQMLYWHGAPLLVDNKVIDTFSPEDSFLLMSLELIGMIKVTFVNEGGSISQKFSAFSTIREIKKDLFSTGQVKDGAHKSLAFEGMKCDDDEALFSFHRIEPRFTIYGTKDQEALDKINSTIKAKADHNEYCYLYTYAKMLFYGIVVDQNKELAAQYYKKACERGHFSAMVDYAELMFTGELPEEDKEQTFDYAKRAAESRHIGAKYLCGIILLSKKRFKDAQTYLSTAGESGHIIAKTAFAHMILKGKSDITDESVAVKFLESAADKKYPPAMKMLAKYLLKMNNVDEANKIMKEAAQLGSAGALYYLANKALKNNDLGKASKNAIAAMELGHVGAKRIVGIMKRRGNGFVEKDVSEAFKLISDAASKGDVQATFHLAKMYCRGDGVTADKNKAFELVSKNALQEGHLPSVLFHCNMLLRGIGCEKDPKAACKEAKRFQAQTGNVSCIRFVGVCQRFGIGCKQNREKALKNLLRAAESDKLGMFHYAMLLKEMNIENKSNENKTDIMHYLKLASDHGLSEAQEQYGLILIEKEEGMTEKTHLDNKKEAIGYFRSAANAGRIESKFHLGLLLLEFGGKDEEAAQIIKEVAEKNHPEGLYYYSLILEEGRGVGKDLKTSRECLQKAAELNVAIAQHTLGVKLCDEKKVAEGVVFLRKACEAKLLGAMMDLVRVLKQEDAIAYEKEIQMWLLAAAELGSCEAAVMAGLYHLSKGENYNAFSLFKKAALKGHIEGMFQYAKMLELGLGTVVDHVEAAKFYRSAVDGKCVPAMYYLGRCFEKGTGVEQSFTNAAQMYRLSAENNDPEGMVGMGKLYLEGKGVEKNEEYALQYFEKAVSLRHIQGNYEYAKMFEYGKGTEMDKKLAYQHFKFASERGYGPAMVFHAHDLLHGIAVPQDIEAGRKILMKAIKLGERDAMFEYAEILDFEDNREEAFEFYKKSADLGHVQGMNCTAYLCSQDDNKLEEAAKYFEKAADLDDMMAACNFGIILSNGTGVIRDQKRAITYLRRSADSGNVEAMYNCGVLLMTAKGDVKNETEAKAMLKMASENGHIMATYNLATLLLTTAEEGTEEREQALQFYKQAADNGCVEAAATYAYYQLIESEKQGNANNKNVAAKYAKIAADDGNAQALCLYGSMLLNEAGVPKNESEAAECFKKAAKKGDINGMFNYGVMLLRGTGVEKDQETAAEYLIKAMNLGHEHAVSVLDQYGIKY